MAFIKRDGWRVIFAGAVALIAALIATMVVDEKQGNEDAKQHYASMQGVPEILQGVKPITSNSDLIKVLDELIGGVPDRELGHDFVAYYEDGEPKVKIEYRHHGVMARVSFFYPNGGRMDVLIIYGEIRLVERYRTDGSLWNEHYTQAESWNHYDCLGLQVSMANSPAYCPASTSAMKIN